MHLQKGSATLAIIAVIAVVGAVAGISNIIQQQQLRNEVAESLSSISDQVMEIEESLSAPSPMTNSQSGNQQAPALTQAEAEALVQANWQSPQINFTPEEGPSPEVTIARTETGDYLVTVMVYALDDSVGGIRYVGTAIYINGAWTISAPQQDAILCSRPGNQFWGAPGTLCP